MQWNSLLLISSLLCSSYSPFFCSGSCLDFILHQVEGRILQFYSGSSLVAWQNALRNASFISVKVKRQSPHFPGECFQGGRMQCRLNAPVQPFGICCTQDPKCTESEAEPWLWVLTSGKRDSGTFSAWFVFHSFLLSMWDSLIAWKALRWSIQLKQSWSPCRSHAASL